MERIRSTLLRVKRPVLWGFFISAALSMLLLGAQWYWRTSVERNWSEIEQGRHRQIHQMIRSAFSTRVRALLDVAASVRTDDTLLDEITLQSSQSILRAFDRLEEHRSVRDLDIDIIDPVGNVVLWAGKSSGKNGFHIQPELEDTLVVITQSGIHSFLSVSLPISERFLSVVVSQPLEVNYPISNRFATPSSFARELSGQLGLAVTLRAGQEADNSDENVFSVPLKDFSGRTVGVAAVSKPTQESELLAVNVQIRKLLSVLGSAGSLFLLLWFLVFVTRLDNRWVQTAAVSVVLWALRYAWLGLEFPRLLVGGTLFAAASYGSPFGFGLTGSLGETLISVVILLINVTVLFGAFADWRETVGNKASPVRPWLYLIVIGISAFFFWLTHGFGEAMRSVVFDSTVEFHDPTRLFPDALASVMYVAIFLLTSTYLILVVALQLFMLSVVRKSLRARYSLTTEMLLIAMPPVLLWGILQFLPLTPKFPAYYPLLSYAVAAVVTWWMEQFTSIRKPGVVLLSTNMVWLPVAALLLSVPMLDHKIHQKDKEYLQLFADEFSRPVDSWLSLVVNDGLRVSVENSSVLLSVGNNQLDRHSDIALTLWSQTLLGREGYNS
ncbi:MAG TPA: hypothetical protein VII11_10475, partial [Bacteroidota bacterium]